MNLRDLRYIVALADYGHFGRAAEACHASQPTLSGQILKLEDELGLAIFERAGRSVRPTNAGAEILIRARQALAAADEIVAIAKANRDPCAGPLNLGVIPTLCPYLMPFVLPRMAKELPNMPLVLHEDLTERLVDGVNCGQLDAALIATAVPSQSLRSDIIFDEAFWLALPTGHPLCQRAELGVADIDPESLLLLTDGHCLRDQALEICGAPNLANNAVADMRAASLETLMHMTAAGYGITLLPALALAQRRAAPDNLVIRRINDPRIGRKIRLISRVKYARRKALETLGQLVADSVARPLAEIQA